MLCPRNPQEPLHTIGTAWFDEVKSELGYTIHKIEEEEYLSDIGDPEYRSVNFNGPSGTSQYCVVFKLVKEYEPHSDRAAARTYGPNDVRVIRAIPQNVGVVKFFFEPYINARYAEWPGYTDIRSYLPHGSIYESVPKHEFGHCVFLDHGTNERASDPSGVPHGGACIMIHNGAYAYPQPEDRTRDFCPFECPERTKVK